MTNTPSKTQTTRRPDCVAEVRMGNTVLTVPDCFKQEDRYFLFARHTRKYPIQ